jgi:hypothetical protein
LFHGSHFFCVDVFGLGACKLFLHGTGQRKGKCLLKGKVVHCLIRSEEVSAETF